MARSATLDDFSEHLGSAPALVAAHIEMSDRARDARAKRRNQHPASLSTGDDRSSVRRVFSHLEDHDVALHRRKIELDATQTGEPFRQQTRIRVILGEAREIMVERVKAGGGQDAGLAHRSAKHAACPPGANDPRVTPGYQAANRTA